MDDDVQRRHFRYDVAGFRGDGAGFRDDGDRVRDDDDHAHGDGVHAKQIHDSPKRVASVVQIAQRPDHVSLPCDGGEDGLSAQSQQICGTSLSLHPWGEHAKILITDPACCQFLSPYGCPFANWKVLEIGNVQLPQSESELREPSSRALAGV